MSLRLSSLNISLGDRCLVNDFSLTVAPGEISTIMGPSGSGKSTILKWIIGILPPELEAKGKLYWGDQRLDQFLPEHRGLGLMFQDHGLFPHLNALQNLMIAIPAHYPRSERETMAHEALAQAGLANYGKRHISSLSGGEQSRLSLLRTLLAQPRALLLDEPFSALDQDRRQRIRDFTYQVVSERQLPTILVTHDERDIPSSCNQIKHLL